MSAGSLPPVPGGVVPGRCVIPCRSGAQPLRRGIFGDAGFGSRIRRTGGVHRTSCPICHTPLRKVVAHILCEGTPPAPWVGRVLAASPYSFPGASRRRFPTVFPDGVSRRFPPFPCFPRAWWPPRRGLSGSTSAAGLRVPAAPAVSRRLPNRRAASTACMATARARDEAQGCSPVAERVGVLCMEYRPGRVGRP